MRKLIALPLNTSEATLAAASLALVSALSHADVSIIVHESDDDTAELIQHVLVCVAQESAKDMNAARRIVARIFTLQEASERA